MAFFLEKEGSKAREVYSRIKKNYEWRSKIVHGLRLSNLQREKSNALLVELEELVRRSLVGILASENLSPLSIAGLSRLLRSTNPVVQIP
jgi:hypothetical protein